VALGYTTQDTALNKAMRTYTPFDQQGRSTALNNSLNNFNTSRPAALSAQQSPAIPIPQRTQSQDKPSTIIQNGQPKSLEKDQRYDYSQVALPTPEVPIPQNVQPVYVAQQRTGFEPGNVMGLQDLVSKYMGDVPDYTSTVSGPGISAPDLANQQYRMNDYALNALGKKQGMSLSDFGIPQAIQEKMKVAAASQVNTAKEAQKEAAKRQLASMGLLNDSALSNLTQQLDQNAAQNIFNQYSNIDTQNALEANKEYQQNLNDLVGGGLNAGGQEQQNLATRLSALMNNQQLNEQGRQFNVTGSLDQNRLQRGTGQFVETAQENQQNLLNAIANFLEQMNFNRMQLGSGVISDAAKSSLVNEATFGDALKSLYSNPFAVGGA